MTLASLPILLAQVASKSGTEPNLADELSKQFSEVLLPILLAVIFIGVVLVGGLMYFFRRGDQAVQARLNENRNAHVQFPGLEDAPTDGETPPSDKPVSEA
jgi:hypothetical protein